MKFRRLDVIRFSTVCALLLIPFAGPWAQQCVGPRALITEYRLLIEDSIGAWLFALLPLQGQFGLPKGAGRPTTFYAVPTGI